MDPIAITDIIAIVSLLLINITAIIISWNRTQIKVKEIDINQKNFQARMEREVITINEKFKDMENDNKKEHKELMNKMEQMLEKLNDFIISLKL